MTPFDVFSVVCGSTVIEWPLMSVMRSSFDVSFGDADSIKRTPDRRPLIVFGLIDCEFSTFSSRNGEILVTGVFVLDFIIRNIGVLLSVICVSGDCSDSSSGVDSLALFFVDVGDFEITIQHG